MLRHPLTEDGLENIKNHQYVPGKYTPLDNALNPAWAKLTEFLPEWMAPNLVTLSGTIPMLCIYGLFWYMSPTFDEASPRWVMFLASFVLWFYQTMDAMDGKQARRTKSSSPLGQLFDHGCDCLTLLMFHSMICAMTCPGPTLYCFAALCGLQTVFFTAQVQEWFTHILPTAAGPIGVTEGQYFLIISGLVVGCIGPKTVRSFFQAKVDVPFMGGMELVHILCFVWYFVCIGVVGFSLVSILLHIHKEGRHGETPAFLKNISPVVIMNILIFSWEADFAVQHARIICFLTGLIFFYYTAQMILFSMAREPYPYVQKTAIPYCVLVILSYSANVIRPKYVGYLLEAFAVWVFFRVFHWLVSVIRLITAKLGIHAFSLKKDAQKVALLAG